MLRVVYETDNGMIEFTDHAGRNRIEDMTGFDLAPREYGVADAGNVGQVTIDEVPAQRAMTIKFELQYSGDMYALHQAKARLMQALYRPGKLTVQRFHTKRCIDVQQVTVEPGERNSLWQDFIVQFTADSPYFHDAEFIEIPVFREVDHILDTFTLPMVFTSRYNDCDVLVEGHEKVMPVITLHGGEGAAGGSDGCKIENLTTGNSITLHHSPAEGEVVTIDTGAGDITSTTDGDLIAALDLDSYLSDFWLAPGHNHIVVTNYATQDEFTALCEFRNNYVEACI